MDVSATPAPGVLALPGPPVDLLPGYVVHRDGVDVQELSLDALDPPALETLLVDAGFEAGAERRFTARRKRLTEVVARVLRFAERGGAQAYLGWLEGHGADLLGSETKVSVAPAVAAGGVAFRHGVCGGCTKDTLQYFVAWTHGRFVITLRVGGPAAGRRAAAPLAAILDARVQTES